MNTIEQIQTLSTTGKTKKTYHALSMIEQIELQQQNEIQLAVLYKALPFIEDHEGNAVYKPGAVETMLKEIRAAIAKAEAING